MSMNSVYFEVKISHLNKPHMMDKKFGAVEYGHQFYKW